LFLTSIKNFSLSDSPLPSQINADGSDVHDFTSNSSIPDFSKFEAARSHLGKKK